MSEPGTAYDDPLCSVKIRKSAHEGFHQNA